MFRLFQGIQFSYIEDVEVVLNQSDNMRTMADGEVEVDDTEAVGEAVHEGEQTGREAMDA